MAQVGLEFGALKDSNVVPILHFNDLYEVGGVQQGSRGGVQRLARVILGARAANKRTLVMFAGDLLSPSLASESFKGKQMVDVVNRLKIDAAVIGVFGCSKRLSIYISNVVLMYLGNHEFDFGATVFLERLKESNFPWLNTNIMLKGDPNPIPGTERYLRKDIAFVSEKGKKGTARVCFFGVAYDLRESVLDGQNTLDYVDKIKAATAAAKELKSDTVGNRCTVVVALSHMFEAQDCEMSQKVPEIDLIIGGHDHSAMLLSQCGKAPVVKGTSDLRDAWITNLHLTDIGTLHHISANNFGLTDEDPADPEVATVVAEWQAKLAGKLQTVIGETTEPLNAVTKIVRHEESNLGNFVADSLRSVYPGVNISFSNSGGIRGNQVYPRGSLTRGTIVHIHPFGNTVVTASMTGEQLLRYVSKTLLCYSDMCGSFLQISGFKMVLRRVGEGAELVGLSLPDGTAITGATPAMKVATNNYVYSGEMAKECPLNGMARKNDGLPLVAVMQRAVEAAPNRTISPAVEGRITWHK